MGHHCPVCHKATHKRCVEKGHLKICRIHGTICGHQRQCVNCSEELRQTLTPRKTEFGNDVKRSLKRESKPATNPRSKRSAYAKLKEALCVKKPAQEVEDKPNATKKFTFAKTKSPKESVKSDKRAEQTAIEDPFWYQRHLPNTDETLPRHAKPSARSRSPTQQGNKRLQVS